MTDDTGAETMTVRRVQTPNGSHITPGLNQDWPATKKLVWKAAVTECDAGVRVRVSPTNYWVDGVLQQGFYNVQVGSSSCGPLPYTTAWNYMNGACAGAQAVHRSGTDAPISQEGEQA